MTVAVVNRGPNEQHFDLEKTFSVIRGTVKPFLGQFISMPLWLVCGVENHRHYVGDLSGSAAWWLADARIHLSRPIGRHRAWRPEMATGVIPIAYVRASQIPIRMILAGTEARFKKMCKSERFRTSSRRHCTRSDVETLRTGKSVGV